MSVIAVVSDGTRVCMACDSQATSGGAKAALAEPKILRLGEFLFAADGCCSTAHFLRQAFEIGEDAAGVPLAAVAHAFIEAFRPWCKERDLLTDRGGGKELSSFILIARKAEWLLIDAAGSAIALASPWWAIGSGGAEARGAMHATAGDVQLSLGAEEIALAGVRAAIDLDDGCSGPVRVEWTTP
jgi:ATP-dependent protease HslVU (ClpYQ) peptidase subunit